MLNITDIDDKIINRALANNKHYSEISKFYEKEFFEDLKKLNCQRPTIVLRVSEHINEIIGFIKNLVDKKLAYVTESGSVYFDSTKIETKLFISNENALIMDEYAKKVEEKMNPTDFSLWKSKKVETEPSWQSPWGPGRPGWHIECSTLATIAFGKHLDIHSGGKDLIFPHHQNELTQCCAFHSVENWSSMWLHTGHLHLKNDVKMSKSLSNTISLKDLFTKYNSNQFRMFCLISPYRQGTFKFQLNSKKEYLF
jgi:cysteinyl-tRNA synthetase